MSPKNNTTKIKALKQARRLTLGIGLFGIFLFWLFNFNFYIMLTGEKYVSTVTNIEKSINKCYQVNLEFYRNDGTYNNHTFKDCTGEKFLFWIEKKDNITIYESANEPYKYFIPFKNAPVKIVICAFFIIVPFIFFFFGKV